jgi:hypothetical protein
MPFFMPLEPERVKETTYWNAKHGEEQVANACAYVIDARMESRQRDQECKYCFYFRRGGMAGQAFTEWNCAVCGGEQMHPNTACPKVCKDCSKKLELCTQCGADLEGRVNKKQKWEKLNAGRIAQLR